MCIHERKREKKRHIVFFVSIITDCGYILLSLSFFFLVSCSCSFFPLIRRGKGNCLSPFESAGEQLVNRRKKLMFFSHSKMEYNVSRNFFLQPWTFFIMNIWSNNCHFLLRSVLQGNNLKHLAGQKNVCHLHIIIPLTIRSTLVNMHFLICTVAFFSSSFISSFFFLLRNFENKISCKIIYSLLLVVSFSM